MYPKFRWTLCGVSSIICFFPIDFFLYLFLYPDVDLAGFVSVDILASVELEDIFRENLSRVFFFSSRSIGDCLMAFLRL